jgi:hypothetical protein
VRELRPQVCPVVFEAHDHDGLRRSGRYPEGHHDGELRGPRVVGWLVVLVLGFLQYALTLLNPPAAVHRSPLAFAEPQA